MGDVVPLFNDRRHPKPDPSQPTPSTRLETYEHMRKVHHWGGPRSTSKAELQRIHDQDHHLGMALGQPHTHD